MHAMMRAKLHKEAEVFVIEAELDVQCRRGETLRLMQERVRGESCEAVLAALQSDPAIDGIWAMDFYIAQGAVQALDELGLVGKIPVTCVGADGQVLQLIESGMLLASAAADPGHLGMQVAQIYLQPDTQKLFWGRKTTMLDPVVMERDSAQEYQSVYD